MIRLRKHIDERDADPDQLGNEFRSLIDVSP